MRSKDTPENNKQNNIRILIVDDEKTALRNLEQVMTKEGYDVTGTQSGQNALRLLDEQLFDVVLTESGIGNIEGAQILKKCKESFYTTEVIIVTASATLQSAVNFMKNGAFNYISKPFNPDEVRQAVRDATERILLKRKNTLLKEKTGSHHGKVKIVTQDSGMQRLLDTAHQIAPTDCNILISGESGTGKELFAKFIHYKSARSSGPFLAVNCGAFTEELLSNELFGHEVGAFTGASAMKKGLIEMASHGTLFLDEIAEMPPSMQVKLLRVIQEKEVLRVGATEPLKVNVRFISATNRDITDAVKNGNFRQDLYFRLNVVSFYIPPLSERKEDIDILSNYFLNKYSAAMKKPVTEISQDVMTLLANYDFPGNVRELQNIVERGVALSNGTSIDVVHLPEDLRALSIRTFRKKKGRLPSLEDHEMTYIQWVLGEAGGNKTLAAQILGIDRVSLWRKLKKFGLEREGEE
jgi:DNA-binding NtrC family response regulator